MTETPLPTAGSRVSLREITADNLLAVIKLEVGPDQTGFVAPNSVSIAQACYADEVWMRAIYADDTPVGFVLLSERRSLPRYYLWRYMIDLRYQGMGFGRRAMEQVIEYVRGLPGATELFLSFVPKPGGPRGFYGRLGFVETGVEHEGELEMRLEL